MIPFLSQLDLLVATGVIASLAGLGGGVFLLARHQRPATRPIAEVEVLQASTAAEPAGQAAPA